MADDFPIIPGSPVDVALTSYARHVALDHPFNLDAYKLITTPNAALMLAFGTRVFLLKVGVTDVDDLASTIRPFWYGQATETYVK